MQSNELTNEEKYANFIKVYENSINEKIKSDDKGILFKIKYSNISQFFVKKWNKLKIYHPKLAKFIRQFSFFLLFSQGVTIFQYLVFTFLPYLLGINLASKEFMWPQIILVEDLEYIIDNVSYKKDIIYNILGYQVRYDNVTNEVLIGGGLGYFIAYEIGTFLAQVINFPLQRNITFKSKGNPFYQAMWYFIAWVLISLLCNAVNGLWMPFAEIYFSPAIYNILVTMVTGTISMVIFFFVFKIIFPEGKVDKK